MRDDHLWLPGPAHRTPAEWDEHHRRAGFARNLMCKRLGYAYKRVNIARWIFQRPLWPEHCLEEFMEDLQEITGPETAIPGPEPSRG